MLTFLGFAMIITFILVIYKKKLSPFVALVTIPLTFGLIYLLVSGGNPLEALEWAYQGVFYRVTDSGDVVPGTMRSAIMIFFAVSYFTLMMKAGLFDPLVKWIMKFVKNDPLKASVSSTLAAGAVSLDGDGTSTVLISTSAFMPVYRQLKMKGIYLAWLIALPTAIFNMTPWGGPLARVLSVLNLETTELFPLLVPGMTVALIYVVFVAFTIGKKERKRLGYNPKASQEVTDEEIERMYEALKSEDDHLKRPEKIWFNFILTMVILILLIAGLANSGILFATGLAIGLVVNYGFDFKFQREIMEDCVAEGAPTAALILGAGFLMGVIQGSGMGDAIALTLGGLVPEGFEQALPLITALVGIPGLIALGSDGFYFGILPMLAEVAASFGIPATAMGVAAMIPLATYYATPLIAWIFMLCDRTECEFGDYQVGILKYGLPMVAIYCIVFMITGVIPLPF